MRYVVLYYSKLDVIFLYIMQYILQQYTVKIQNLNPMSLYYTDGSVRLYTFLTGHLQLNRMPLRREE